MISSALGALSAVNTLTGGRLGKFVGKNVGKFVGKVGKWGADKLLPQKIKDKLNGLTERGASIAEKVMGEDSELAKNMKNFSKEMKGENVDLRSWNDGDSKSSLVTNIQDNNGTDIVPYTKNLGGTNYKRYIPTKRFPIGKRIDLNRLNKFGRPGRV